MFTSSQNAKSKETSIIASLKEVKGWCDINKLSMNLSKTNYMIVNCKFLVTLE